MTSRGTEVEFELATVGGEELTEGAADGDRHVRSHRVWTPLARALVATGDRWTLMIVHALAPGRMRLTQLQRALPGVSAGVLERYIRQMGELGLVTRSRFKEMPPRVELELTDAGHELLPIAGALARWGMRNSWTPPAERERIDVPALLCMLPALLEPHRGLSDGTIEAILTDADAPARCFYRVSDGRLRAVDPDDEARAEEVATVVMEGDRQAWIAALGPYADYGRLRLMGEERLARGLLDALPR